MTSQPGRAMRLDNRNAPPGAAALLCGALLLGGCSSYQARPVDPALVAAAWQAIDATAAGALATSATAMGASGKAPATGYALADGINLAEAEATALFFNPGLRAARLRIGIPAAEAHHARLWQDPELQIDGEYVLDDVAEPWVLGAGLALTIPLSGQTAVAQRLAEARVGAAEAAALGAEWALLSELRRQWLRLAESDARAALLQRSVDELQQLIDLAPRFRAAQAVTVVDERLLHIQQHRARDALHQAEAARAQLRLALLATLGLHPGQPWRLQAALDEPAFAAAAAATPAGLLQHPALREVMAAYQVAEQQLRLQVRRQYPDLRIGLGGIDDQGEARLSFGLGLLPLPTWNANRQGIATAEVERAVAGAQVEAALQELVHRHAAADRQLVDAQARVAFLRDELAPLVDRQIADARRLTALGHLDLFLLVDAMEQARQVRLDLLGARADALVAALELAALAGPPLPAASGPSPDRSRCNHGACR